MGRYGGYTPTGYYMNKMKKEEDKYSGLLSNRQKRDLDGGAELKRQAVKSGYISNKVKEQQKQGFGDTFMRPVDYSDYK